MSDIAGRLAQLLSAAGDPRTDGELLTTFLAARDEDAFAELVRRHGPLVRAACRRVLPDPADADDAFQAAFLVLVRRGARLDPTLPLGPWLYRVAVLTARTVRRGNARRYARREAMPALLPAPGDTTDLREDLDAALLKLPEKYRTPLILCHLQGWSRHDAAEQLGCPEGTLSSILSRGLAKLRERLRGYDPTAALVAPAAAVPLALVSATAKAATGAAPAPVAAALAGAFLRGAGVQKLAAAAAVGVLAVVAGVGATVVSRQDSQVVAEHTRVAPPRTAVAPAPRVKTEPVQACGDGRRVAVAVGGPAGWVPLKASEVDAFGRVTGDPLYFTSFDALRDHLAAVRTSGCAPQFVQVDVWEHAFPDHARGAFRACQSAGYKSVVVNGYVPVLGPARRIIADELLMDLTDLVPPEPTRVSGGGGGSRPGCAYKPNPCRAPADVP